MPYNKNQFRKVNDKKVLHKVKSHWVAVSLSLLMALGGTAVAGQAVHADNNVNSNNQNNVSAQLGNSNQKVSFTEDNGTMSDYQQPKQEDVTGTAPETGATEQITPQYVNDTAANMVSRNINSSNGAGNLNSEINSLEQPANVGPTTPASSNVIPEHSASNKSASNSASSSEVPSSSANSSDASISYVSGDNGSAASYHAKASTNQSLYQFNSSLAEYYINSLNSNFGTKTVSLKSNYSAINSKYQNDQSIANSYFNIANDTNYSQEISSLASENGQTASNYVQSISYQAASFANNISQGNNLKSQMAVVNSYAQLINNLHSNSGLRVTYSLKAQSASYALEVENAYSNGFASVASALSNASNVAGSAMLSAVVGSMDAATSNELANVNTDRDNATVDSLASALGYGNNNTFSTGSAINSYVRANFVPNASGNLLLKAASGNTYSNVAYSADSSDNVYTMLNDTKIKNAYNSNANSYENVVNSAKSAQFSLSGAIASATANVQSESSKYSAISSAAAFYSILSNPQVGLNNIFGTTTVVYPSASSASVSVSSVNTDVAKMIGQDIDSDAPRLTSVGLSPATIQSAADVAVPKVVDAVAQANDLVDANNNVTNVPKLTNALVAEAKKIGSAVSEGITYIKNNSSLNQQPLTFKEFQQKIDNHKNDESDIYKLSQLVLAPIANDPSLGNDTLITPQLAADVLSSSNDNLVQNTLNNLTNPAKVHQMIDLLEHQSNNPQIQALKSQNYSGAAEVYANAPEVGQPGNSEQPETQGNLLNSQSYSAASNAVSVYTAAGTNNLSYNVSAISSVAKSASAAANNAVSASEAYDSSADVSTALAGSLLGSYDDVVYSDQKSLSAAKNSLTDFYNQYAPDYLSASSTAASASSVAPVASKLAQAYGMHVYNYAPKYITAIKDVTLQSSLDDSNSESLTTIKRGRDRIHVNGVGFDRNGNTYYAVTYNGQNGYVTADPNATKNSYLFATPNNRVTVTFIRNSYEYNNVAFNKKTIVKPIKVGEQRSGVIVSEDNTYGGWTRIRLDNGNYITANTSWIDIDLDNSNNNDNHSNPVQQNKVNFA